MRYIAIIEDETDIANLLAHCFACEGFEVSTAGDGRINTGIEGGSPRIHSRVIEL